MLFNQETTQQVLHDLELAYQTLPVSADYTVAKDFRRKVSKIYFRISHADTSTIRSGVVLFLKKYEGQPKTDQSSQKIYGAYDVVYSLNRYLFEAPKGYQPSSPWVMSGQDMKLYPWAMSSNGALIYSGEPFGYSAIWPNVRKEFNELARKCKRRSEIDPSPSFL